MSLTITLPLCPHAPGGNQVWLHAFALSLRGAEMTRQPSLWVGAHAHASRGQSVGVRASLLCGGLAVVLVPPYLLKATIGRMPSRRLSEVP